MKDLTPSGLPRVTVRGRVIANPVGRFQQQFALRGDDGTTIALTGVYGQDETWLMGAKVEIEGRYDSTLGLEVIKLTVVTG